MYIIKPHRIHLRVPRTPEARHIATQPDIMSLLMRSSTHALPTHNSLLQWVTHLSDDDGPHRLRQGPPGPRTTGLILTNSTYVYKKIYNMCLLLIRKMCLLLICPTIHNNIHYICIIYIYIYIYIWHNWGQPPRSIFLDWCACLHSTWHLAMYS